MIYVVRLIALKRHFILFEALKSLPNVRLLLIGTGSLENDLRRKLSYLGIDSQVVF